MNGSIVSVLICVLCACFLIPWQAHAEIPRMISYQGRVTDSGGTPVSDGTYSMHFKLFDAESGGAQEWESGTISVQVTGGMFDILLGESPQPLIMLQFDEDLWLEVTFDGVVQSPRQRMASVGYAYMASGLVPGTQMHETILGELLHVHNQRTSGEANGIEVRTNSSSGYAVIGMAEATSGLTRGVYGRAYSANGRGVMGYNSATTGSSDGIHGETASTSGRAVYGWAFATSGVNYGGLFETESTSGTGVRGIANATTGETYGVYGRSYSTTYGARGVYGRSYATTGGTTGVYGRSDSEDGYGVYGRTGAANGTPIAGGFESVGGHGVCGWAMADAGTVYGVYGYTQSTDGRAIYGYAEPTTGDPYGVYGACRAPSGYAVYGRSTAVLPGSYYPGAAFFEHTSDDGVGVEGAGGYSGGHFWSETTANSGWVGRETYKIVGWGSVSFQQNHPYRNDQVIVYAAPEGDEVATYTRGIARLSDGEARVSLGETFKWVTNPDLGLTAHLTPRGECKGLYVASLTTDELVVRELDAGHSSIMFDYLVFGLRIGFEDQTIVQEKREEAYIPSMEPHRSRYRKYPELRQYSARERFKAMHAALVGSAEIDFSASERLRDAIQEYDPSVHGSASDLHGNGASRSAESQMLMPPRETSSALQNPEESR